MNTDEVLDLIDSILHSKRFNSIQELVFRHSWEGASYTEIADRHGYDAEYIKQVGCQIWQLLSRELGQKVSKCNCHAVLKRHANKSSSQSMRSPQTGEEVDCESVLESLESNCVREKMEDERIFSYFPIVSSPHRDWGEAVDVNGFYGREKELALLSQWIQGDRCRIVAILGMGGVGKTFLSVKLAQQVQHAFDYVIWLNVRGAPPVEEVVRKLTAFLSHQQAYQPSVQQEACSASLEEKISCLMEYLRNSRCFIVLDDFGSVLQDTGSDSLARNVGQYRDGCEGYGQLVGRIGESPHQSCLVLTSREEPRQLTHIKGKKVQCLFLKGLDRLQFSPIQVYGNTEETSLGLPPPAPRQKQPTYPFGYDVCPPMLLTRKRS